MSRLDADISRYGDFCTHDRTTTMTTTTTTRPITLPLGMHARGVKRKMTIGYFFTQLVQAYLIVSMDVWGLDR